MYGQVPRGPLHRGPGYSCCTREMMDVYRRRRTRYVDSTRQASHIHAANA